MHLTLSRKLPPALVSQFRSSWSDDSFESIVQNRSTWYSAEARHGTLLATKASRTRVE